MILTFAFPFKVNSPHRFAGQRQLSNQAPGRYEWARMPPYVYSSIPTKWIALWQGTDSYAITVGHPTTTMEDLDTSPGGGAWTVLDSRADAVLEYVAEEAYNIGSDEEVETKVRQEVSYYINSSPNAFVAPSVPSSLLVSNEVVLAAIDPQVTAQLAEKGYPGLTNYPLPARLIAGQVLARAGELMSAMTKSMKLSDVKIERVTPPDFSYGMIATQNATMAAAMGGTCMVKVNVETGEMAIALLDDLSKPDSTNWQADVDAVNQQLLKDVQHVLAGDLLGSEVVTPTRPSSTVGVEGEAGQALNQWWADIEESYKQLKQSTIPASTDRESALAGGSTVPQYLATRPVAPAAPGTSAWNGWMAKAGDLLSTGASKVWDTISGWSPSEWAMGYAGYTAVQSTKESDIPSWLIIGGVALGALAILK